MSNRYEHLEHHADLGEGAEEFDSTHRFTRPCERAELKDPADQFARSREKSPGRCTNTAEAVVPPDTTSEEN